MAAFLRSMQPVIRIVFFIVLALVFGDSRAPGEQASGSAAKPTPATVPIPLEKAPLEAQSALDSLQELDANVSRIQSSAENVARTLSDLTSEIDSRIADERRLLATSPSLDVLYPLKLGWRSFGARLALSARALTQQATSLEEQLGRLDKLTRSWQATLQTAKQPETPSQVLPGVQKIVDSAERTRQAGESSQARVLALQSSFSEQETRVRTALSSIEEAENRALEVFSSEMTHRSGT